MVDGEGEGGAGGARVEVGGAVVRVERVERWVPWRKPVVEIGSFFVREELICLILHRNHFELGNWKTWNHRCNTCLDHASMQLCTYPSFDNREGKMRKKFDRSFFCCRSGRRPAGELC